MLLTNRHLQVMSLWPVSLTSRIIRKMRLKFSMTSCFLQLLCLNVWSTLQSWTQIYSGCLNVFLFLFWKIPENTTVFILFWNQTFIKTKSKNLIMIKSNGLPHLNFLTPAQTKSFCVVLNISL